MGGWEGERAGAAIKIRSPANFESDSDRLKIQQNKGGLGMIAGAFLLTASFAVNGFAGRRSALLW